MGVFKNEVGRPSNETIKKRNIFKGICVLLVLIIITLLVYILNDKGIIKINKQDNDKKVATNVSEENKNIDPYEKYKNIKFITTKESKDLYNEDILLKIENGKLSVISKDSKKYKIIGLDDEEAKYVTYFGWLDYGGGNGTSAVLTESGNLYVAEIKETEINFSKVETNNKQVKEIMISDNMEFDEENRITFGYPLYALLESGELLRVENMILGSSYDERVINFSPHQLGGYSGTYYEKDKSVKLNDKYEATYNDETVKAMSLFTTQNYDINNSLNSEIFILNEENYLLTSKEKIIISLHSYNSEIYDNKNHYDMKLYNNKKVKNLSKIDAADGETVIQVTYEDDTTESFGVYSSINIFK